MLLSRTVRASTPQTLHSSANGLLHTLAWLSTLISFSLADNIDVERQDD